MSATDAAGAFERIHPLEYYRQFIKEGLRPDGRGLHDTRAVSITVGAIQSSDGSALAKLGRTSVVCGIKYEVTTPSAASPEDGRVNVQVHLLPVCSSKYKSGKPTEESQSLAEMCTRVLESSGVLTNSSLCIEAGKHVWLLRADVMCLNDDGNLADATVIALMAALRNVRLPEVNVSEQGVVELVPGGTQAGLEMHSMVAALSFVAFDDKLVVDPTAREESVVHEPTFTMLTNTNGDIGGVYKPGGKPLTPTQLDWCVELSASNAKALAKIIETAERAAEKAM